MKSSLKRRPSRPFYWPINCKLIVYESIGKAVHSACHYYVCVCVCVWILVLSNDDGRCDGQAYNYVQSRRVFNRHYRLRKYNIPYTPPPHQTMIIICSSSLYRSIPN